MDEQTLQDQQGAPTMDEQTRYERARAQVIRLR
jgi:hypothetical protein